MGQKAKQQKRYALEQRAAARQNDSRIGRPVKPSGAVAQTTTLPQENEFDSNLPVVKGMTMDKQRTILMDDGFAIHKVEDGWRIKVSIVDMPSLVADGSNLEKQASRQRVEYTLDNGTVQRVFPYDFLRGKASFQPGMKSKAITFDLTLDKDLKVTRSSIYRSVFKNCCSYYFNNVDEDVEHGNAPMLGPLFDLGEKLYQKRINDAVLAAQEKLHLPLAAPEYMFDNGIPKSKQLVCEVLCLANAAAAEYVAKNKLNAPVHTKIPHVEPLYVSRCYEFDRQVNVLAANISRSIMETPNSNIRVTGPMRAYREFLGLKVIAAHLDNRNVGGFGAHMVRVLSEEFRNAAARRTSCEKTSKAEWQQIFDSQKPGTLDPLLANVCGGPYAQLTKDCKDMKIQPPMKSVRCITTPDITLYMVALGPVNASGSLSGQPVCGVAHTPYEAMKMANRQFRQQFLAPKSAEQTPHSMVPA